MRGNFHVVILRISGQHGGGVSVYADIQVAAHDKAGRERVLRDCARPMFAGERLSWLKEAAR